jgi:hypothetical protein
MRIPHCPTRRRIQHRRRAGLALQDDLSVQFCRVCLLRLADVGACRGERQFSALRVVPRTSKMTRHQLGAFRSHLAIHRALGASA